ncbi:hypothetical protein SOV_35960 [Sporomusa ovata DSM 2662]|uniref:Uncharacterized protein n=1 Tax=Sporomusa ovata TaxID=2378 RepID=A0A0U1L7I3_9FIRM|nr:hypothetical protein [Sporomusa ovata]EQB24745.1 hypothetical protein SOV_6c01590 [Sporomusa ovata DSM 2662]CQR75093.1 hypothetical protein SpAn4DRAFT_4457 [Sporomusa ovata]
MKTITITITGGSSISIVIKEQKPDESKEAKRKAALAYLDAMFKPVLNYEV